MDRYQLEIHFREHTFLLYFSRLSRICLLQLQSLEAVAGEGIKCVLTSVLSEESVQLQQLSPSTKVIVQVDSVTPEGYVLT